MPAQASRAFGDLVGLLLRKSDLLATISHMRTQWVVVAMLCASCARRPAPPDLPQLAMEQFLPAVRAAVEQAYNAARANPRDAAASGKLGMVLAAHEQHRAAEICLRRAHLLDPKTFDWLYYLGASQTALGNNAEAAATFEQALRLRPDYVPAHLRRADALLAAGNLEGATAIYTRYADDPTALYGLGRAQSALGRIDDAIASLTKACELFPGFGAAHYALSQVLRRAGRAGDAARHVALYEKDKLGAPPSGDPLMTALRALSAGAAARVKEGVRLEQEGRLAEAAAAHEKALTIDPKLAQAHVNLVSLYGRLGNPERALRHYREAVALNPNLPDAHYNYGVLVHGQGKIAEAREAYRQAIRINPNYAEAHNNLGDCLQREGKLAEARSHFEQAIRSRPDFRAAHFHLGRLLANRGAYDAAIGHFLRTLTPEDESTPSYLYALGAAYARAGDRESALGYVRRARDQALSRGQTQLLSSIERDLRTLEGAR